MSRYVEFTLPDGSTLYIESDEPGPGGVVKATRGKGDVADGATSTFEQAAETARQAALIILDKVRSSGNYAPNEVEITFGLKASGELQTLVVAKAGMQASYCIKMTWKSPLSGGKAIPIA